MSTTKQFRIVPADAKQLTHVGRAAAKCGRVRIGVMRRWIAEAEESTFNIHGVTSGDVDDRYMHVHSIADFNSQCKNDARCLLPRVVLDVEVSTWVGDFWEPNDWIHPIFEKGRLIGFASAEGASQL